MRGLNQLIKAKRLRVMGPQIIGGPLHGGTVGARTAGETLMGHGSQNLVNRQRDVNGGDAGFGAYVVQNIAETGRTK